MNSNMMNTMNTEKTSQVTDSTGVHVPRQNVVGTDIYSEGATTPALILRDKVRWGPVWAGLMTALTCYMVLEMFCYWIGLLTIHATGGVHTGGSSNLWVSAIVALIAFFFGGWLATSSAAPRTTGSGALNGFVVWALGIVVILTFSALGAGLLFGAVGNAFGQFFSMGQQGVMSNGTMNMASAIGVTRDAAGWGLLFLILSALAAIYGGMAGTRTPIGTTTTRTDVTA